MPIANVAPPPPARAEPLRAQAIGDTAALEALAGEWEALWLQVPGASAFQSPRWLLPWWRHIGQGALAATTVRTQSGELVALAPWYVWPDPQSGRRHLFPLGIATTDHLDPLLQPGFEARALACIGQQLAQRDDWDLLEIPQLRRGSPLLQLPPPWSGEVTPGEPSPVLALANATLPPLPRAMAQNVRTARHRANRAGTLSYELADARTLPHLLQALLRLHAERWSERDQAGVLADPAVLAFHRESAPLLLEAGLLRLHALRLDGEIVAVLYVLADPPSTREPRHCYYIGGFDPRQRALSPGTLLIAHAIEQAVAEGAVAFDFLRGAEGYKYRWGATDEPMFTLRARRRSTG